MDFSPFSRKLKELLRKNKKGQQQEMDATPSSHSNSSSLSGWSSSSSSPFHNATYNAPTEPNSMKYLDLSNLNLEFGGSVFDEPSYILSRVGDGENEDMVVEADAGSTTSSLEEVNLYGYIIDNTNASANACDAENEEKYADVLCKTEEMEESSNNSPFITTLEHICKTQHVNINNMKLVAVEKKKRSLALAEQKKILEPANPKLFLKTNTICPMLFPNTETSPTFIIILARSDTAVPQWALLQSRMRRACTMKMTTNGSTTSNDEEMKENVGPEKDVKPDFSKGDNAAMEVIPECHNELDLEDKSPAESPTESGLNLSERNCSPSVSASASAPQSQMIETSDFISHADDDDTDLEDSQTSISVSNESWDELSDLEEYELDESADTENMLVDQDPANDGNFSFDSGSEKSEPLTLLLANTTSVTPPSSLTSSPSKESQPSTHPTSKDVPFGVGQPECNEEPNEEAESQERLTPDASASSVSINSQSKDESLFTSEQSQSVPSSLPSVSTTTESMVVVEESENIQNQPSTLALSPDESVTQPSTNRRGISRMNVPKKKRRPRQNYDHIIPGADRTFHCTICNRDIKGYSKRYHSSCADLAAGRDTEHKCNQCGQSFKSDNHVKYHIRSKHTGERPFQCLECGSEFYTQNKLGRHIKMTHLGHKPFSCQYCQKRFSSSSSLKAHKEIHAPDGRKRIPCPFCDRKFRAESYLKKHTASKHRDGPSPFQCEVCQKTFASKTGLEVHQMRHTGEKSFVCQISASCSARFLMNRDLVRHEKTHFKDYKPFRCAECGNAQPRRDNVVRHLKNVHRITDEETIKKLIIHDLTPPHEAASNSLPSPNATEQIPSTSAALRDWNRLIASRNDHISPSTSGESEAPENRQSTSVEGPAGITTDEAQILPQEDL